MLSNRAHLQSLKRFTQSLLKIRNCSSQTVEREKMYYDVVTIGAGPAGLAAAIRLKQLSQKQGVDISVCVVEKAAEIGAHTLSGNVFEPHALDELIPDWRNLGAPVTTRAKEDRFLWLTEGNSLGIPHALLPPQLHNDQNYIISLSQLTRWLGTKAEELGVEIYPGFAADEVLYREDGSVRGVSAVVTWTSSCFFSNRFFLSGCDKGCWYC